MSNYTEPEENLQEGAIQDVSPLMDEATIERHYTAPNLNVSPDKLNSAIPEPDFVPPPMDTAFVEEKAKAPKEKPAPLNPALNEADKKDTNTAAAHLAGIILSSYEDLHALGNRGLMLPERKLNRMQAEGTIDLRVNIPYDLGKVAPAGAVIQTYNEQIADTFEVTKEFKKEVRPVLERVLAKKGAGMTDEQMLLYMFGKDIAMKGVMFYQVKQQGKELINLIAEATRQKQGGQAPQGQVVQPVAPAPPPPPAQPATPAPADAVQRTVERNNLPDLDIVDPDEDDLDDSDTDDLGAEGGAVHHATGNDYINDHYAQMVAAKENTDVLRPQRVRNTVGKGTKKRKKGPRAPQTVGKGTKGRPSASAPAGDTGENV